MAVAISTTNFPGPAGPEVYDRINAAMNVASDPPEGLIFHWAGEVDGKWTLTDVWESRAHHGRFREERLDPAIQKISGMDPTSGPQPTISEFPVHSYLKP